MNFRLEGRTYRGRAVDLSDRGELNPGRICSALGLDGDDPLALVADSPPSLHELLASAARTRGHEAPQADRIATLRRRLAGAASGDPSADERSDRTGLAAARERAADATADVERLRERVATARGRLQAVREDGGDVTAAGEEHERAARELAAAETDRVAAEQALEAAGDRAQRRRTDRRETLRLRDELANRRREARRALAERVYEPFTAALERVPGDADPGTDPSAFAGDAITAHLAAVAVADRDEPVVLAVDRFDDPAAARDVLGAPVVQI
ncbi:hypothetical protein [Halorarum halobium]|uniref:DUF7856 family protein n=1 Tax=Halorarum halobium TaxID=3075121 RepID=UPI0028AA00D3|nr:hypothetical protein [Halobaculum sp. XH14]